MTCRASDEWQGANRTRSLTLFLDAFVDAEAGDRIRVIGRDRAEPVIEPERQGVPSDRERAAWRASWRPFG